MADRPRRPYARLCRLRRSDCHGRAGPRVQYGLVVLAAAARPGRAGDDVPVDGAGELAQRLRAERSARRGDGAVHGSDLYRHDPRSAGPEPGRWAGGTPAVGRGDGLCSVPGAGRPDPRHASTAAADYPAGDRAVPAPGTPVAAGHPGVRHHQRQLLRPGFDLCQPAGAGYP
ncbi:hypothetical protein D3C85_1252400 [compost metagenome]